MSIEQMKAALKTTHHELASANPAELAAVIEAVQHQGRWFAEEEWRISTWYSTTIEKIDLAGKDWYRATVECDGQQFQCRCPTIAKAYEYARVYQRIILCQFYSVGPPWA